MLNGPRGRTGRGRADVSGCIEAVALQNSRGKQLKQGVGVTMSRSFGDRRIVIPTVIHKSILILIK